MAEDNFYRDFEERFYAPREIIKELRKVYLPFVKPLVEIYRGEKTFDLGCGRGEWLELMSEIGFEAYGCDIDEGMLRDCYERGLSASKQEAVSFLKSLPDESHVVISAFHVIEHISFDDLRKLVSESLRILKPGGLLLLETPNPENVNVATNNFYLDPTHKRPIPPLLLSFLPEYYGFKRYKLLRLQESSALATKDRIELIDIFSGVSPDIAIVAQKNASAKIMNLFNQVFDKNYGITLNDLSARYDTFTDRKIESIRDELTKELQSVYHSKDELTKELQSVYHSKDELAKELQTVYHSKDELTKELQTVYHSKSWRITLPLRKIMQSLKFIFKLTILKSLEISSGTLYRERQETYAAEQKQERDEKGQVQVQEQNSENIFKNHSMSVELNNLSPRAQKIYLELRNKINFTKNNEISYIPYIINFKDKDNNSKNFIDSGFCYSESWGTWSSTKEATLFFDLAEHIITIKPLYLKINFHAHAKNNHSQLLEFYLNNKLLARDTYENYDDNILVLDIQNIVQKQNKLTIKIPNAISPKALDINEDNRELGIGLIDIQLTDS
ncbi:MAG: class I SAM-dependent methyltransferase [bacterium]